MDASTRCLTIHVSLKQTPLNNEPFGTSLGRAIASRLETSAREQSKTGDLMDKIGKSPRSMSLPANSTTRTDNHPKPAPKPEMKTRKLETLDELIRQHGGVVNDDEQQEVNASCCMPCLRPRAAPLRQADQSRNEESAHNRYVRQTFPTREKDIEENFNRFCKTLWTARGAKLPNLKKVDQILATNALKVLLHQPEDPPIQKKDLNLLFDCIDSVIKTPGYDQETGRGMSKRQAVAYIDLIPLWRTCKNLIKLANQADAADSSKSQRSRRTGSPDSRDATSESSQSESSSTSSSDGQGHSPKSLIQETSASPAPFLPIPRVSATQPDYQPINIPPRRRGFGVIDATPTNAVRPANTQVRESKIETT